MSNGNGNANSNNQEKLKALQLTLDKIEKGYGKGAIMKLGDNAIEDVKVFSSGSLGVDLALGVGGFPRGRVIEIYGPESSGKTTLAIHAIAEAQKAAFPDIQPLVVGTPMDDVAQAARKIIEEMNMDVLDETEDGKILTIEAASTSFWFGFVDDFVVRIQPSSDNTRIDVRSKSRVGVSDLGANAQRVRTFVSKLEDATR